MCETVVLLTSRAFKRSKSNFVFSFSSSVLLLSLLESSSASVRIFSMPSLHLLLSSDSFSWNDFLKCHYSQVQMKLTMQISPILTCIWMKKTEQVAGGMIKVLNEWSHEGSVIHAMPILQVYAQPNCYIYFRILRSRTHHVFNNFHFLLYKLQWTLNVPAFSGSILPLRDKAVYWGKVRVCSCLMYFTFLHLQLIFELLTNGPRIKLLPDEYWFKIHSSI